MTISHDFENVWIFCLENNGKNFTSVFLKNYSKMRIVLNIFEIIRLLYSWPHVQTLVSK